MKPIKIIDLSTLLPGPFSTYLLQKYTGAEVLKIEDISQGDPLINMRPSKDGIGLAYKAINSSKKIIRLDLRRDGLEKIKSDIKNADVFIHNQKSSRSFKLGIGFEDILKINPKIIYCSVSGFGSRHPLAGKSAHDLNILALSGYLDQQLQGGSISSLPPMPLADMFTGHNIAIRLLSSLLLNQRGVHLNISMFDSFLDAMIISNYPQLISGKDYQLADYPMSGNLPCYGLYDSGDGGKLVVAALEKPPWVDFCNYINRQDLIESQFDPAATLSVAQELVKFDKNHWLEKDLDFCVTPVMSILEARKNKYV